MVPSSPIPLCWLMLEHGLSPIERPLAPDPSPQGSSSLDRGSLLSPCPAPLHGALQRAHTYTCTVFSLLY